MRFDIILYSDLSADDMVRYGKLAEEYGLGGVWIANNTDTRDAFVNFVPLAMQTERLRMGPIAVSGYELHPIKIAQSLLTLNAIANGRAQIVIGGGGGTLQNFGMKPARMVRALRGSLELVNYALEARTGAYRGEIFKAGWIDTRWAKDQPTPMVYAGANGPQMLGVASKHAAGIMVSDFTPERVRWTRDIINPNLAERSIDQATYPLNNFWAWHVQEDRQEALREARTFLCVRGSIWPDYIDDHVDKDEARIVTENLDAFVKAYQARSGDIQGVPDNVLTKICDSGTSASSIENIGFEIERMRTFRDAGLTEIALCIYSNPEQAIRLIGEHLVPALS
jgi:alkanesulfonate monooxygenase SsuD/methylene tetrahydromethanopterin reductase-like flavin-dependent oxidoreductase (luciferase family)